ncbi:hypothetical protein AJ79_09178 [Helicocarpus griseus UAMH5409]|uniref:CN hydrolase domain-containing protein n=1 Tax=Helicocarpus griseus UAMH5409 TaxID=1447875 RepID=A0A2B7WLU5_9EURO|nr:hypothetical protein AJ79_09178 [Helicocarpus griseus UAMH5409]
MSRKLKVAAAQVGTIHANSDRAETLQRLITLLKTAASQGAQLVVFPETTFTTFFPRYVLSPTELDKYFEKGDDITQSENVKQFFDTAQSLHIDVCIGYAELTSTGDPYNTCVYYSATQGKVISKYRKIHLPGTSEPFDDPTAINQLEKKYFKPGNLGFNAFRAPGLVPAALKKDTTEPNTAGKGDPIVGMMICNDRRWPESWRAYGLQGVELVLCGYNTPNFAPDLYGEPDMDVQAAEREAYFHHKLVLEYNSYANSCYSISAARAGLDDGKYGLIGGSSIVDPNGHTIAEAAGTGDEVVVAEIDLGVCRYGKETMFDFGRHRRIETYGMISSQTGVIEPPLL